MEGITMKAVRLKEYGDDINRIVEINPDIEVPELSSGKVLVKVHAAAVNPIDWKITQGYTSQGKELESPVTLGGDFTGTIAEVGEGVTEYGKGDDVYGTAIFLAGGSGAYAQYLSTDTKMIAKKPENANNLEAAALPLVGVSALDVITKKIKLQEGQKILIHGGSGGIGSMAIQIAKHLGAYVATTARADKTDYLRDLGADKIIDYKNEKFEDKLSDYDAVFDTVGGDTYKRSYQVLKKGGIIVSMLESPDEELMNKYQVNAEGQFTQISTDSLQKLAELYDRGVVTVNVDRAFPMDKAVDAMAYQRDSSVKGKVVIEID